MGEPAFFGERLEVAGHCMGYFANIHFVPFELQLAGGYAGHVEKRRRPLDEERHQPINLLEALGQLFRREVAPLGGLTQKSDATDDRRHWISQLVRRERQEAVPCRDLFGQARVLFGQFANATTELLDCFVVRHRNTGRITARTIYVARNTHRCWRSIFPIFTG
jgi:hypothetical protein